MESSYKSRMQELTLCLFFAEVVTKLESMDDDGIGVVE